MAYVTAAEVKAYSSLAIVAAVVDADLTTKYIPRAERLINSYTRQNFNLSASKTILVNGSGSIRQELSERLVTLSQVRFLSTANGGATILSSDIITDIYNKGWWLEAGNENLHLRQRIGKEYPNDSMLFPQGSNNIEVTGTFGYATVPLEVNDATCAVVEAIVSQASSAPARTSGFNEESIGDYSYNKGERMDDGFSLIPPESRAVLAIYLKPILAATV